MFSSLIGLGTAFSSYTCPAVYAPIALASFAYGYGSARKSFDNHYGSTDSHDYLTDSGLVNTTLPLILDKAFKLDLFTSNIGVAFYWMGGVIHPHYRKSFIIDRVSDMVTTPFFHYGHESTILPWLFRSFSNYNYDDNGIPAANPYSYYSVMGDLKDSYNLSYGYKKTLSPQLLFQGSKSIRTDRGILTMTMDRANQEALIKIRSLTLFERLNELMFDTFGFYLQEKQYIDVKNEDISKSINEFYKDHYIQDTLPHFHLAEPMPAQLEDIAQSLDIYEQHQSNNDVKIITLPTGRFIINENKARNSISFNFQPYAKNEVKPEMYDCPLTWRLAQKVNVALNTRSNDSLLVDMNISRLNEVLIAAGLDKQESEGFKKSFKLKYTHQEIEKLFGIRREYIKTFNQHHQFIGPKKITQITLPNTAFGADKIAALLKLLKEESHEEIRIVSDRMTHDGGEKLLIALNNDDAFSNMPVKYFEYHPQRRLNDRILALNNINLSIKTLGYGNPNIIADKDSLEADQGEHGIEVEPQLKKFNVKKDQHHYSVHVTHIDWEKPKFGWLKFFNTIRKFIFTEFTKDFIVGIFYKPEMPYANTAAWAFDFFIIRPLDFLKKLVGAGLIFLKFILFGLGSLYLKLSGADEDLFRGHKLKVPTNIKMQMLIHEPSVGYQKTKEVDFTATAQAALQKSEPLILSAGSGDPKVSMQSKKEVEQTLQSEKSSVLSHLRAKM